jgi:carbon monoxide dehydrogenase subunit G
MKMSGEEIIAAPRQVVWDALNDPEVLKQCITGCEEIKKKSDTEMEAKVTAKVGPVKASFVGAMKLSKLNPPRSYVISGEGKGGMAGFAKGGATVQLSDTADGQTKLSYDVDAQVGGKLAQIGSRLIDSTAKKMAADFFKKFNKVVSDRAQAAGTEEKSKPAAKKSVAKKPAARSLRPRSPQARRRRARPQPPRALRNPQRRKRPGSLPPRQALPAQRPRRLQRRRQARQPRPQQPQALRPRPQSSPPRRRPSQRPSQQRKPPNLPPSLHPKQPARPRRRHPARQQAQPTLPFPPLKARLLKPARRRCRPQQQLRMQLKPLQLRPVQGQTRWPTPCRLKPSPCPPCGCW